MKKVTAIFLLSLMLLLAVHPVLALHYCGDKLYSFSLVQATGNSHSCCCDVIEQEGKCSHETNDIPTQKLYHSCGLSDMHNTCCNIQLLTLNTDDYLNKSDHLVSPITTNYFDEVIALSIPFLRWGYWIRPEFIKMPLPNVLSNHFYTSYYGYVRQLFPPGKPIVEEQGLKLVCEHPEWIRLGKNGVHPIRTSYNWTPASLTKKGWYEEVIYKDLIMMKKLGYNSVFQDGGGTNLSGVDYTEGRARAIMPYFWRLYQDMAQLGLDLSGELPSGWGNNTVGMPSRQDMKEIWALAHSVYRGNLESSFPWYTAEMRHKSHQLYAGAYLNMKSAPEHATVAHFAQKFLKENGHPDRVFMQNLRWDETKSEWVWDAVYWEYKDGHRVRYPNYSEVIKP